MTEEKDLAQIKREAAAKARAEALARMATKKSATDHLTPISNPMKQETNESIQEAEEEKLKRLKREAVVKAKAEAQMKLAERQAGATAENGTAILGETEEEKLKRLKREAVAKAKAEAQMKLAERQTGATTESGTAILEETEEEKLKRLKREAVAKAKAEALAKKEASSISPDDVDLKEQKRLAVEKAKAAALAKKQGNTEETTNSVEVKTSIHDALLQKYIKVIQEHIGEEVIKESYINFQSKEVPTLVVSSTLYYKLTQFLRYNEQLAFDSLVELHATDYENHIELYVYLYSYINKQHLVIKTSLDRNKPEIESITPIWPGANWPECEAYDLLGIHFKDHPYLHRILLGEDWKGYPLRKDYKPYDDMEV